MHGRLHVSLWARAHMLCNWFGTKSAMHWPSEWVDVRVAWRYSCTITYIFIDVYFHKAECRMRYIQVQYTDRLDKSFVFTVIGHINIERMGHWDTVYIYACTWFHPSTARANIAIYIHEDKWTGHEIKIKNTKQQQRIRVDEPDTFDFPSRIHYSIDDLWTSERIPTTGVCVWVCSALQWRFRGNNSFFFFAKFVCKLIYEFSEYMKMAVDVCVCRSPNMWTAVNGKNSWTREIFGVGN